MKPQLKKSVEKLTFYPSPSLPQFSNCFKVRRRRETVAEHWSRVPPLLKVIFDPK